MNASVPFRDTFWNVPGWAQVALYVGAIVAVTVFVYGLAQRVRLWLAGRPEPRLDRIPERVALVGKHALGQAVDEDGDGDDRADVERDLGPDGDVPEGVAERHGGGHEDSNLSTVRIACAAA